MINPSKYALSAILCLSFSAQAADLLDTFHAAQANDAVFAAELAKHQAEQEKLPQGRSLLLPTVSANANTMYNVYSVQRYFNLPPGLPFPPGTFRYNTNG